MPARSGSVSTPGSANQSAARHDRSFFLERELPVRAETFYPPYCRMANILVWGKDERAVSGESMALRMQLESALAEAGIEHDIAGEHGGWQILGPSPCLIARRRGDYRWHILVKAPVGADIPALLAPVLRGRTATPGANVAVDVDPTDLF